MIPISLNVKIVLFLNTKLLFDVSSLIRPKYRFDLKKCLTKLNPILKLCIVFLSRNNICQIHDANIKYLTVEQLSLIESAVGTQLASASEVGKVATPGKLLHLRIKTTIIIFVYIIMHEFKCRK